jgi:hypothetical protein
MKETGKTYWKKLTNSPFLGAWDIPEGGTLKVKITAVGVEEVVGTGGKTEELIVAQLEGYKPMVCNVTNCKMISQVVGSKYVEDWVGKTIVLGAEVVKFGKELVDAIRVRPERAVLPTLTQGDERWDKAVEKLKSGQVTIDYLKEKFSINEVDLNKLTMESHNETT